MPNSCARLTILFLGICSCVSAVSKHRANVNQLLSQAPPLLHRKAGSFPRTQPVPQRSSQPREGLRVSPINHGGDPTGIKDSTAALNAAVTQCVNQSVLSPNGVFPGTFSFGTHAIRDMGGCVVDLEGGEYRISSTIKVPEYTANMQLGFGSIVAGPDFPTGDFLVQIGEAHSQCQKIPQGSCNIDINIIDVFFDGSNKASALQINNVMGVTVGPGGYFLNFSEFGMQINQGHEVMMDRCWLGETNFDFDFQKRGVAPNATAIQINGNDHYILNTIVFSSKIGLEVNGAADYVTGVHVWFPINQALHWNDTMAFHVTSGGNRFSGCYADGGRVVFAGAGLAKNMWTNGFECCAGAGLHDVPHGIILRGVASNGGVIGPGLQIWGNEFNGGSIYYEDLHGVQIQDPPALYGVRIHDNSFADQATARGTRVSMSMDSNAGGTVVFDLCDKLLFPHIESVRTSVHSSSFSGLVPQYHTVVANCTVTVKLNVGVGHRVTIDVDSSAYQGNFV